MYNMILASIPNNDFLSVYFQNTTLFLSFYEQLGKITEIIIFMPAETS